MRLTTKKWIDETIGFTILVFLNLIARILGGILRRNHSPQPVRTILVMKFQGMGSLVIAKPGLLRLRRKYPSAKILFFGTPSTCTLARLMVEFDEVFELKDQSVIAAALSALRVLGQLWMAKIDWAFDLEVYSNLSGVLLTLTCARNRSGFVVNNAMHRRFTFTHLLIFNRYEYLGNAYDRLFSVIDQTNTTKDNPINYGTWKPELTPLSSLPSPYCVINIHAGDLSLERRWPKEYFAQLIDQMQKAYSHLTLVLIGHGAFEIGECASMRKHTSSPFLDLSGKLSLTETLRCLSNASLVISNDTAPLHLALSTRAPVIGLFGPTRPEAYFPTGRPASVALSKSIYCSPCVHHWEPPPCGGENQCMKTIKFDEVMNYCEKLLNGEALSLSVVSEAKVMHSFYPGIVYSRPVTER